MSRKPPPVIVDEDNPEWTAADFVRAKRGDDIPEHIRAAFPNTGKPRGRPVGSTTSNKEQVTLRVDRDALERFRADGPGWQSRINQALRESKGLLLENAEGEKRSSQAGGNIRFVRCRINGRMRTVLEVNGELHDLPDEVRVKGVSYYRRGETGPAE